MVIIKIAHQRDLIIICDLDNYQFSQCKIDHILKANSNISDEKSKQKYNLVNSNTSTIDILQTRFTSNSPLIQVFTSNDDNQKQQLLMSQKKP